MIAVKVEDLYYVRTFLVNERTAVVITESDVWHKRLGHANKEVLEDMKKENLVRGMSSNWKNECESCIEGKTSRRSHQRHEGRRTN
ncbi:hypothetical protein WN51_09919 [Melipona quadrifasciata]|uniref:GAG-pre-integrase domain-containing protein n=1 Tax=Melipona quadrifasciata TaxID=166423 RepID=A0A0M9AAC9_9HYME|nr:hypothetical protein WN51_09919 [Melipona quadrifasciata]